MSNSNEHPHFAIEANKEIIKEHIFSFFIWSWARHNPNSTVDEFKEKYAWCVRMWSKHEEHEAAKLARETPMFDGLA